MPELPAQRYKEQQLRLLPDAIGVYALCDLDNVPIYVGQSTDSIAARVRRHLTSARSDVIANRQIDVWEIAFVRAWPVAERTGIDILEASLFNSFDRQSPLVNGKVLATNAGQLIDSPRPIEVQVIPDELLTARRDPTLRFPRQIQHFNQLVDYVLNTQDKPHLRRALKVYFDRMSRYYTQFVAR